MKKKWTGKMWAIPYYKTPNVFAEGAFRLDADYGESAKIKATEYDGYPKPFRVRVTIEPITNKAKAK